MTLQRWATLSTDEQCRFLLGQETETTGPILGWLMCNPSRATHLVGDPTAGRVVSFSARHGYARSLIGNIWAYRTPYPADLWHALDTGIVTPAMIDDNLTAIMQLNASCDKIVLAFGAEPGRRYPQAVRAVLDLISKPLMCLGTTADNRPLHPLARGKQAIRNETRLRPWCVA